MLSSISADNSSEVLTRMAIGTTGRVGWLYDGTRDRIVAPLEAKIKATPPRNEILKCEITEGNSNEPQNLWNRLDIEADLRLSILLNISSPKANITALINHPNPFNKYTRFLCYTYVHRTEELDTSTKFSNYAHLLRNNRTATHIITNISWGINVVIVSELLPDAEKIAIINEKLEKIQDFLKSDQNNVKFSLEDEAFFENNVKTTIYSNISEVTNNTSIFTLCQFINRRNELLFHFCRPLKYQLTPIKDLYPECNETRINYCPVPLSSMKTIEEHLIQLTNTMKNSKYLFHNTLSHLVRQYLKEQVDDVQEEWQNIGQIHRNHIQQLQSLIIMIRSGQKNIFEIDKILEFNNQQVWDQCIGSFTENLNQLERKSQLIDRLHKQHFEYHNVNKLNITNESFEQVLINHLKVEKETTRVLCSTDTLNEQDQFKFEKLRDQLIKQYEQNENLRLLYADFSYCSFQLHDTIIITSDENIDNKITPKLYPSLSRIDEVINILLLGETGVGKSTFINAFTNYLVFETLKQVESNEPFVPIPTSFLTTIGDDFEERIIKLGSYNDSNNDNFDHPGQAVTQQCQSYLFTLNHIVRKKIRIIDTPGLDQDDLNMEHILKYINNLSHINAVCFLLKPNLTQLNYSFTECLTKLFSLLSHQARQNIIFCFTHARSTFYTPGNTGSLLKSIFNTFPFNDVPFQKDNTFCFDNKALRYLIAKNHEIQFKEVEQREYKKDLTTSINETKRLINYIDSQLIPYPLHNEWKTIKHAQIEIMYMVRPMLETMRNILRHMVLYYRKICHLSVKLIPTSIRRRASLCNHCEPDIVSIAYFRIISDIPHEMLNHCYQCSCESSEHNSIDYFLHYQTLNRSPRYFRMDLNNQLEQLQLACNEFAYFLTVVCAMSSDPFLIGLENMVRDEVFLSQINEPNEFNQQLAEYLKILKNKYETQKNRMNADEKHIELSSIYQTIKQVSACPEVQEQMVAIKTTHRMMMEEYEYVVPEYTKKYH